MIFEKTAKILADYRDIDIAEITAETKFEDIGLDSLDMVDLVMQLEEEFDVQIEIQERDITVGDLVSLIESLKK